MPCCRIESISSCNASRPKSFRGCSVLGTILARSIWCTLSPDSATSEAAATDGVPISAPRPLPRPERAMGLRLPEQLYQGNQQSVPHISMVSRTASSLAKEFLKKVLTLKAEIQYQCGRHQNRQRTLPGRFFVCLESSDLRNQNKH